MESVRNLTDAIAVWIDFNIDSGGLFLLTALIMTLLSAAIGVAAISVSRHKAAAELANYSGSGRHLSSFVCKVCLHRSYAKSHIQQRYCARCGKYYSEAPKILKFHEIAPNECPANLTATRYPNLAEPVVPIRGNSRA